MEDRSDKKQYGRLKVDFKRFKIKKQTKNRRAGHPTDLLYPMTSAISTGPSSVHFFPVILEIKKDL